MDRADIEAYAVMKERHRPLAISVVVSTVDKLPKHAPDRGPQSGFTDKVPDDIRGNGDIITISRLSTALAVQGDGPGETGADLIVHPVLVTLLYRCTQVAKYAKCAKWQETLATAVNREQVRARGRS